MSTNLFSPDEKVIPPDSPLSARMRPCSLEEFVGQTHILGEGKLLARVNQVKQRWCARLLNTSSVI